MEGDPLRGQILLQLVLMGLIALMQAADTALRSMHPTKLKKQAEAHAKTDVALQKLLDDFGQTPSGLQLGMILFMLILVYSCVTAYRPFLLAWLKPIGMSGVVTYVFLILISLLLLVLVRALPARLAKMRPTQTANRLMHFSFAMMVFFSPLARLVSFVAGGMIRLFGISQEIEEMGVTEDEIRMMVDAGEEKGAIEESERDMIENVFEFNNMTAEECMTHRTDMHAIWVDEEDEAIIRLIEETGFSRFPVYTEDLDHIIGVLTTRDYLMNRIKAQPLPLKKLLRSCHFVPESIRTDVLFRNMQKDKIHMAIVVDEYGGTGGIITMEDLLEEIVGNIYDEYDLEEDDAVEQKGKNTWRVPGSIELEEFNEQTGLDLPLDDDYDTVAGLILNQLGSIPDDGTKPRVSFMGLEFLVEEVADRRIEWVEVKKADA